MDSSPHIRGAADNLQQVVACTCRDTYLADAEFVGVGMGRALLNIAHHHASGAGSEILDRLHFKAGQR